VVAAAEAAAVEAEGAFLGAGISLRRRHLADAIVHPEAVDFVEIVADHYFAGDARTRNELGAIRERFTVVPHGLDLSLGSAEGISDRYVRRLKSVIEAVDAPYWSEHVAFTHAGGRHIGHLAPLPTTFEALDVLAANLERVRKKIDRPLILENIACSFDIPYGDMDEPAFLANLVERTNCGLLLDVANLYYNALNRGLDPHAVLAAFPLDAVVQCHLAGGHRAKGEWIDSHAFPVPEAVWQLFEEVVRRAPRLRAALVERDENLPPYAELAAEAARARAIMTSARTIAMKRAS
jgi:uncharacterized protein (UPF0276 family)